MSNYLAIVADIKAKFEAIADIGMVHGYDRRANSELEFINLFTIAAAGGKKMVLGWEITRASARESKKGNTFFRHHRMRAAGYMSIVDSLVTDQTFQVLVDTICAAFRVAEPAGGDAAPWFYMDGLNPGNSCAQAEVIDQRMFGTVLCHHADIYITITERIIA